MAFAFPASKHLRSLPPPPPQQTPQWPLILLINYNNNAYNAYSYTLASHNMRCAFFIWFCFVKQFEPKETLVIIRLNGSTYWLHQVLYTNTSATSTTATRECVDPRRRVLLIDAYIILFLIEIFHFSFSRLFAANIPNWNEVSLCYTFPHTYIQTAWCIFHFKIQIAMDYCSPIELSSQRTKKKKRETKNNPNLLNK